MCLYVKGPGGPGAQLTGLALLTSVWFLVTQRLKLGRFLITVRTDVPLLIDVLQRWSLLEAAPGGGGRSARSLSACSRDRPGDWRWRGGEGPP